MAATYRVDVAHGATPSTNAFPAGGRFHRYDSDPINDISTTFVPIPDIGLHYSWRKSFRVNVLTAPVGSVSNLRVFSDGVPLPEGVIVLVKTTGIYSQGSVEDNVTPISDGVDVDTYNAGSPLIINPGVVLSHPTTGYGSQNWFVIQFGCGPTTEEGTTFEKTLTYRVDET